MGNGGQAVTELILHNYDFSSFSEKIRLVLGLKGLTWRSVAIPSVMPKPDLTALTGGYRHTPVLQIGADVYCDTRLIARELDRRFQSPPLFQDRSTGVALAIEAWAERDLFWPIARYASGMNADDVAPELHADRAAMRGKHAPSIARVRSAAERSLALMDVQFPRVENMLGAGHPYLLAEQPQLVDFAVYHGFWFLSAMPVDCSAALDTFPRIRRWMQRIRSIGHGKSEDMSSQQALQIAARSTPAPARQSVASSFDPPLGFDVAIRPEDYATAEIVGKLYCTDRDEVALLRADPSLGDVVVHFPRVGYVMRSI